MRRGTIWLGLVLAALAAFGARAEAQAQNGRTFGERGIFTLSSDAAFTAQRAATVGLPGATTTLELAPAADYFLFGDFSVGGFVGVRYTTTGANDSSRIAAGPRIGYHLALSPTLSLWPKAGVSFAQTSTTMMTRISSLISTSSTTRSSTVAFNLYAPFMLHPASHFFVGFGPFVDSDLGGEAPTTAWGGRLTLGGWL